MLFLSDHGAIWLKLRIPFRSRIRDAMKNANNKNNIIP